MTDAQRARLTDRQIELAFLGLYEQHKNDVGTAATLVQIQIHLFALAERLEELERNQRRQPNESETVCYHCDGSGWTER